VDRYTDNKDGTVTDTKTGLMWQKETPESTYTWKEANEIVNARRVMRVAMNKDSAFKEGYIANISCCIYDELHKINHRVSMKRTNKIAEKVLNLVFWEQ